MNDDFIQALVDETPRFDELIMQDIRPTDGWISVAAYPSWWWCREEVRQMAEGDAYRKTHYNGAGRRFYKPDFSRVWLG